MVSYAGWTGRRHSTLWEHRMHNFLHRTLMWLTVIFLVTGCATSNQPTVWLDPA